MKKTLLLKTMLLLCALVAGSLNGWAEDVTFTAGTDTGASSVTKDGITVSMSTMSRTDNYRTYANTDMTVSSTVGNITKIVVTCTGSGTSDYGPGKFSGTGYTYSGSTGTWTGNATSVTLSASAQVRMTKIVVTYTVDTRTDVNMESFTAEKTTLVVGETTTTTVTNDQSGWTPSYTYSSDKENVATIDEDGVITAVGKGTATITATLNVSSTDENYKEGSTKSKTLSITVNNPSHNVIFSVNGVTSDPTSVEEGNDIQFPEDPSDIGGKVFMGWTATAIDGTTEDKPALVTSATMGSADVTYFAVFATKAGGIVTINDVLDNALTGVGTATTYSEWSGKSSNSSAVYAGNSAGSSSTIQLRSKENSGIVTTASGGTIKKIVIDWHSSTAADRTLDIYGKNTAYEATTDLYNDKKQGTKLGSIKMGSTDLTINGSYTFIGLRSNSGAMYINSITITWESEGYTYSGYCTTIPSPSVTITATGYTTFSCNSALDLSKISEGATAYVATEVAEGLVKLQKTTAKVPAGTGLFIKGTANETYTIDMTSDATEEPASNLLVGAPNGTTVEKATEGFNYVFGWTEVSNPGFYLINNNSATLPAGKAYLHTTSALDAPAGSRLGIIFDDGEVTSIESVSGKLSGMSGDFFDLLGRKVANPTKGLYIVNGKKVVIK